MLRHFLFGLSPSHLCIIRIYRIPLGAQKSTVKGGFLFDTLSSRRNLALPVNKLAGKLIRDDRHSLQIFWFCAPIAS